MSAPDGNKQIELFRQRVLKARCDYAKKVGEAEERLVRAERLSGSDAKKMIELGYSGIKADDVAKSEYSDSEESEEDSETESESGSSDATSSEEECVKVCPARKAGVKIITPAVKRGRE